MSTPDGWLALRGPAGRREGHSETCLLVNSPPSPLPPTTTLLRLLLLPLLLRWWCPPPLRRAGCSHTWPLRVGLCFRLCHRTAREEAPGKKYKLPFLLSPLLDSASPLFPPRDASTVLGPRLFTSSFFFWFFFLPPLSLSLLAKSLKKKKTQQNKPGTQGKKMSTPRFKKDKEIITEYESQVKGKARFVCCSEPLGQRSAGKLTVAPPSASWQSSVIGKEKKKLVKYDLLGLFFRFARQTKNTDPFIPVGIWLTLLPDLV